MNMSVLRLIPIVLVAGIGLAQNRDVEFARLADRYFDEVLFRYDPVQATHAGFHQYDHQLPSGSRAEFLAQIQALQKIGQEVEGFGARGLSRAAADDRDLL